ncbi:phenylacetate--CoA ligase family protein [Vibrio neptunius]|uniref:phenylacetate--CoA ligase family protein n=1 Tax=Vibrio neptunius TaxID=170651 RepID=UPI0019D0A35D|nr:AMP-binding protein [Vibrio neptunius]MBN3574542.1 AMP-binding protein [Vibrio neptunius]QXX05809.1 AMP-binding protein [Vibrio neptunius]
MSPDKIRRAISYASERSFYRKHWGQQTLAGLEETLLSDLPVVRKTHLRDHWTEIMNRDDAVDYVSSSGTTGRPVDVPVHRLQEMVWVASITRVLRELGLQSGDRLLQTLSNNDMFTLGPLINQAAKQLGISVFRCSPQRVQRVVDILNYHRPDAIVGNPLFLDEMAAELGPDFPKRVPLPRKAYFAACPTFDALFQPTATVNKVQTWWQFETYINEYGCSEIGSIGFECQQHQGFHIHDEYLYVELLDPQTGLPVPEGEPGEVVVTTLTQPRGFAAVRYATGDIASGLYRTPCLCGRTSPRLGAIVGRIDQQFKIRGQNLYPEFVLNTLEGLTFLQNALLVRYQSTTGENVIELWLESALETHESLSARCNAVRRALEVQVAQSPPFFFLQHGHLQGLIHEHLRTTNGVKIPRLIDLSDDQFEHGIAHFKAVTGESTAV